MRLYSPCPSSNVFCKGMERKMANPLLAAIGAAVLIMMAIAAIVSLTLLFTHGFLSLFRAMKWMK